MWLNLTTQILAALVLGAMVGWLWPAVYLGLPPEITGAGIGLPLGIDP